jgi:hypothetical protein
MMIINFLDAFITLSCAAIGVRFGGVVGAALGCLIGACIGAVLAFGFVIARLGLRIPLPTLTGILLATALMSATLRLGPVPTGYLSLGLQIALGFAVYLAGILALLPQSRQLVGAQLARFGLASPS